MIKKYVTPTSSTVSFEVPSEYVGKRMEIIAFSVEESVPTNTSEEDFPLYLVSEPTLARDWNLYEEDRAWKRL